MSMVSDSNDYLKTFQTAVLEPKGASNLVQLLIPEIAAEIHSYKWVRNPGR